MRDIVLTGMIIVLSTYGFFIRSCISKKFISQFVSLLFGVAAILLVNFFVDIFFVYNIYLVAGLATGYILSFTNPLIFFNIFSVGFTGAFCLSSHANPYTMLFCLAAYFFIGYAILTYIKPKRKELYTLLLCIGLLAYLVLYVIMVGSIVLNGITVSILALVIGASLQKKPFFVSILPMMACLAYFSFILYPDSTINVSKLYLPEHRLADYEFISENNKHSEFSSKSEIIMIETWHQYCSKCFESMKDLHFFFSEKGGETSFKHYYLFVGTDLEPENIYNFDHLPAIADNILIDKDLQYYESLEMQGAPYLNFYKDGKYLFSYSGYNKKYRKRYLHLFNQIISSKEILEASTPFSEKYPFNTN